MATEKGSIIFTYYDVQVWKITGNENYKTDKQT